MKRQVVIPRRLTVPPSKGLCEVATTRTVLKPAPGDLGEQDSTWCCPGSHWPSLATKFPSQRHLVLPGPYMTSAHLCVRSYMAPGVGRWGTDDAVTCGPEDPRGCLAFTLGLQPFLTSGCLSVVQHMGGWRQCRKLFFSFPNKSQSPTSGQTPGTCVLGTEEPP